MDVIFFNVMVCNFCLKKNVFVFFPAKREMPILFFVNCERTVLFSVKRDLDPPFTTHWISMLNGPPAGRLQTSMLIYTECKYGGPLGRPRSSCVKANLVRPAFPCVLIVKNSCFTCAHRRRYSWSFSSR